MDVQDQDRDKGLGLVSQVQEDKDNRRRMAPEVRGSRTLGTWQHRAMNRSRAGAGNGHWLGVETLWLTEPDG